jgi:hypothetical protein
MRKPKAQPVTITRLGIDALPSPDAMRYGARPAT